MLYVALVVVVGAIAARRLVASRVRGPARSVVASVAARTGLVAGAVLPLAMATVLWRQFAEFRDPFFPWTEDLRLLIAGTAWGRLWVWAATCSLAIPLAFAVVWATERRPGGRVRWAVAALPTVALCAFPALSGHAAATTVPWLSLPAAALHVLAAGAWTGTLLVVVASEVAARRGGGESVLPALVPAFSPVALASAAVLVCTGAALAVLHLDSPADLVRTPWGRVFAAKIILVTGVLAVGAWNWRRIAPLLARSGGRRAMRRAATVELILAQAVVLATALLTRFPPPASGLAH